MIIPSIDISEGKAVQLVGGEKKVLDAGDPRPIAEKFSLVGEIAVVDLDAAMGKGSNEKIIRELLKIAPCRVGGGIRDVNTAIKWLDAGAKKIMLGTAAVPEVLNELPRERVIVALDAKNDEVVVKGWTEKTGKTVKERLEELKGLAGGFLVTFVELEGRMQGTALKRVEELIAVTKRFDGKKPQLTIAGGITTADEVAQLDALGAEAQVGMALYTNTLTLSDGFCSVMKSDRTDGLWPTVVTDEHGACLGLAWSSRESLAKAIDTKRGIYHSRKRGIWVKGETSGALQNLLAVKTDCDRDTLCFVVKQHGSGFCHNDTRTCWGTDDGGIYGLSRRLSDRASNAPVGSYTKRLFEDTKLLNAKLVEEAQELAEAQTKDEVIHEASDLLYFTLTALARAEVGLSEVESELDSRALKLSRRPGDAKQ